MFQKKKKNQSYTQNGSIHHLFNEQKFVEFSHAYNVTALLNIQLLTLVLVRAYTLKRSHTLITSNS